MIGYRLFSCYHPCKTDAASVKQVVFILMDNANKYCDEGGTVRVDLEPRGRKGAVITLIDFKEAVKLSELGKKLGIEFERLPHVRAAVPAKKGKQTRQHGPRAARPARKHNK